MTWLYEQFKGLWSLFKKRSEDLFLSDGFLSLEDKNYYRTITLISNQCLESSMCTYPWI